jgi:GT2 family glycosyltransferase
MTGGQVSTGPAISLIVATLGRVEQVAHLFRSLAGQHFVDFEVIVVDQNDDDRLRPVVDDAWPFRVRRLHTPGERGASRGRNRGWREAAGALVLFPDDDCWYPPDFLDQARTIMAERCCDVLTGRPTDETGRTINGRFSPTARAIDMTSVWTTAIEWIVLFRRSVLEAIDGFDEAVGIGADTPWQSSEAQDIIIRAVCAGYRCWFDPDLVGFHEEMVIGRPDAKLIRKARGYARGMGFVLRLHGYGWLTMANWIARPTAAGLVSLARGRPYMLPYYTNVALGRLEGALRRTLS